MAVITNDTSNTLISGTSGNDSVWNWYGDSVTIDAGAGDDSVYNSGSSVTINSGTGNDYVYNGSYDSVSINGGDGDDTVYNYGNYATINGGEGNDYITLGNYTQYNLIKYKAGDGNDTVLGLTNDNTLSISGDSYTTQASGYDVLVNVGSETICLKNAYATADTININGDSIKLKRKTIKMTADNNSIDIFRNAVSVVGSSSYDYINNYGSTVTINAGAENDTITSTGDYATIDAGGGDDNVYNYGNYATINGGAGNDYVYNNGNNGDYSYINLGAGNDEISNYGSTVTIDAGAGNDTIYNNWSYSNDAPFEDSDGANALFNYTDGDGNDIIYGFRADSTLNIDGTYSKKKSGKNIIVTVGDGKISLIGAASLSTVNIKGTKTSTEKDSWTLSGTTATYGTTSKTLITVTGVKSLDGISLSGKVVTVAASALNKKKVSIAGSGYTLKLADDVSKPTTKKAAWTLDNSTATYKSSYKTAGYTLASNSKSITYAKATTASTLAKVSGVKSTSGLSISNKVVTVAASALNKKKVTLSGSGYTLKFADDVTTPKTKKAAWSLNGSTATYKSSYKTAGYTLASNGKSISYATATTSSTLATIKGAKSKSFTVSGSKITLKNTVLNKKVTVSGGYDFNFSADYKKATISGSSKADTITTNGSNLSVNGGAGDDTIKIFGTKTTVKGGDGADVFVFKTGSNVISDYAAEDKISIASGAAQVSTKGDDIIFTANSGKLTVKGGADKTISYTDASGEHTYPVRDTKPYTVSGAGVTLSSSYNKELFDVSDIDNGDKLVTIDGSAVTHKLRIKGNSLANKIIGTGAGGTLDGGKGTVSDTLIGGDGSDIFIYYEDDGNDVIKGYDAKDTIKIEEGVVSTIKSSREDVVFQIGDGKLTVQDVKGTRISFVEDGIEYGCLDGKRTLTISKTSNDTIATLSKNYWKESFDVAKIGNEDVGNSITKIYASSVARTLQIAGNAKSNQILGSSTKANTITGGGGNDTLQGGSGADVFVYAAGDGIDSIVGYDTSDKISITSGTVENVSVNADNDIVLTIGAGKIILDNASGKKLTYYDDEHRKDAFSEIVSPGNVVEAWFIDDDNFATANDLSALVQSKAADYSFVQESLIQKNNQLQSATYSKK